MKLNSIMMLIIKGPVQNDKEYDFKDKFAYTLK